MILSQGTIVAYVARKSVTKKKVFFILTLGKGWRFVYVARYSYDPFQHSPNESPEAELQVNAGNSDDGSFCQLDSLQTAKEMLILLLIYLSLVLY
jgi:hypothetical protein